MFKYFAQGKGKKPDGSQTQFVAHLIQNLTDFLSEDIDRLKGFLGKLERKGKQGCVFEEKPELVFTQTPTTSSKRTLIT